jgi:hypothetical protein
VRCRRPRPRRALPLAGRAQHTHLDAALLARLLDRVERVRDQVRDGVIEGLGAAVGLRDLALDHDGEPVAERLQPMAERVDGTPHHRRRGERLVLRPARRHELLVRLERLLHTRELRRSDLPTVELRHGRPELARNEAEPRVEARERLAQLVDQPRGEELALGRRRRASGGSLVHGNHARCA